MFGSYAEQLYWKREQDRLKLQRYWRRQKLGYGSLAAAAVGIPAAATMAYLRGKKRVSGGPVRTRTAYRKAPYQIGPLLLAGRKKRRYNTLRNTGVAFSNNVTGSGGGHSANPVTVYPGARARHRKRMQKYRRRIRRGHKGYKGTIGKYLWNSICHPIIYKNIQAFSKAGNPYGRRTHLCDVVCSASDVQAAVLKRPAAFLDYNAGASYNVNDRMVFTEVRKSYIIQNRSNWDMQLKIYECICRRDVTSTEYAFNLSYACNTLFRVDDQTVRNKHVDQTAWPGGTLVSNIDESPVFTPYMSSTFCSKFKILSCHSVQLGPNEYINRTYRQSKRSFPPAIFDAMATTGGGGHSAMPRPEGIAKWTKILVFSWIGGPVDVGNSESGASIQSKSKNDLFVQSTHSFHYHFLPAAAPIHIVGAGLSTQALTGANTTQQYTTSSAFVPAIPATCTVQTISGTAGADADDTVTESHP